MSAVIFAGPSLRPAARETAPGITWLPPARHGDVYRAVTLLEPRAVGIVDGYFRSEPAVLHKEILWAMDRGVHVFGAASMGALRAAELATYGMHGIGTIFRAYRDGVLAECGSHPFEDDDEVAVVHGPPESGYLAASEAMVNVRLTLFAAARARVIDAALRDALIGRAKRLFFPDRNYDRLLDDARRDSPCDALEHLAAWLPAGRIDQKHADALALVEAMCRFLAADPPRLRVTFDFEHTTLWQIALGELRHATPHTTADADVLDEHRLLGPEHEDALARMRESLVIAPQDAQGMDAREATDAHVLLDHLARQRLADAQRDAIPRAVIEWRVLDLLRERGVYARLLARAEDKRKRLAMIADLPHVDAFDEHQHLELDDWYFTSCLGSDIPDDLEAYVATLGFGDMHRFHAAIFAEFVYRRLLGGDAVLAAPRRAISGAGSAG